MNATHEYSSSALVKTLLGRLAQADKRPQIEWGIAKTHRTVPARAAIDLAEQKNLPELCERLGDATPQWLVAAT